MRSPNEQRNISSIEHSCDNPLKCDDGVVLVGKFGKGGKVIRGSIQNTRKVAGSGKDHQKKKKI